MATTLTFTSIAQGSTAGWDVQLKADLVAIRDAADLQQTSVTGNAGTATKLATPRAIAGVNFDGSAPITLNATGIVFTPTGGIGATTVAAAILEAMNDAIRVIFPNYDTQQMNFAGYGTALPGTVGPAGTVFLVAG